MRPPNAQPWMIAAAVPAGVLYFMVWNNWDLREQWSLFAYFSVVLVAMNAAMNCVNVPFTAITPDLSHSYHQATALTQVRVIMEICFGVVIAVAQSALVELFRTPGQAEPDYARGYEVAALGYGALVVAAPVLSAMFLREKVRTREQVVADTRVGVLANVADLLAVLRRRNFVLLMLMYFLCWTSVVLVQNNLFLLTKYSFRREDHFVYLVALVQLAAAVAAVGWSRLTHFFGKRTTYLVGGVLWVLALGFFYFMSSETPVWVLYAVTSFGGVCLGVGMLLPWSMLPDVIDEDECLTGMRREGAFYSLFVLLQKVGLATALATSAWVLGASGYEAPPVQSPAPDTQPASAVLALRMLCGPAACVLVLLSMVPVLFYDLSRSRLVHLHRRRGTAEGGSKHDDEIVDLERTH